MWHYNKIIVGNIIEQMRRLCNMTQSWLAKALDFMYKRQFQRIENRETELYCR